MHVSARRPLDVFLVVAALAAGLALAASPNPGRFLAAALAAGALLALLGRRRHPLLVSVMALVLLAASLAAAPNSPNVQFFAVMATFAIVAAVNTTRDGIVAGLVGVASIAVATAGADPGNWVADLLLTLGFCMVMWTAGWLVSRHTRRADVMVLRAQAAEQQQEIAVRDERARIARELHDVVSHGLSVVVLQTLAAQTSLGEADAVGLARHLDAVETSARQALGEMRHMLGLLQVDDLVEAPAPTPGLRQLPELVERARQAGLEISESDLDTSAQLPPGTQLTLYRVAQEALTNIAKHAPGARVSIQLRISADEAMLEIIDDGSGHADPARLGGTGRGLIGMRERVGVYGGSLLAQATAEGGFAVLARIPLEPAPAAPAPTGRA